MIIEELADSVLNRLQRLRQRDQIAQHGTGHVAANAAGVAAYGHTTLAHGFERGETKAFRIAKRNKYSGTPIEAAQFLIGRTENCVLCEVFLGDVL